MLEKIKIMAIIREVDPEITIEVIKALAEEGLQSFEISLSDPELGIEAIIRSLEYFQGSDVRDRGRNSFYGKAGGTAGRDGSTLFSDAGI